MTTAAPASPTITRPRGWKHRCRRLVRSIVTIYLLVALVLALLQTKLIFMGASTQGTREAIVTPPPGAELLELTAADGTRIAALFARSLTADPARAPTILWFYGNAMCLADALAEVHTFRTLGANVLAVEYAGYGMSGGSPSEQGCYAAAEAAYQHLLSRADIDTHNLVAAGWSLGGAVAIDLAARHANEDRIRSVMTFSAFTSLVDVARTHYPIFPVGLMLKHHFPSLENIQKIRVPILIGHGRHDDIAPYAMSDRLAAAAAKANVPTCRLTLESAAHNDFFSQAGDQLERAIAAFLEKHNR